MTPLERLDALINRGVFYDCDWETLRAVRDALAAEREACAKVADDYATANASYLVSRSVASAIASAIRARTGET